MTRNSLRKRLQQVIALVCLFIIGGGFLFYLDRDLFQTFRDFILLLVAIPAALLTDYFQKRNNFEEALRNLWSQISESVNEAKQYTFRKDTSEDEYRRILVNLSRSIDEVRSVYKNLGETKSNTGFYPFESLKIIYVQLENLGFGRLDESLAKATRDEIDHYWKNFKEVFLWEFDRPEPESFNTPHEYGANSQNNFKAFR